MTMNSLNILGHGEIRSLCMSSRPRHDCLQCPQLLELWLEPHSHNAPIRPISTTHAQLSRQIPQQSSALPDKDRVSSALESFSRQAVGKGQCFNFQPPVTRQSSGLPGRVAPGSFPLSAQACRGWPSRTK